MSSDPASLRFHALSLSVAAVAAAATYGVNTAMLPAPAMFLGWVAFDLAGPSWRDGAANTGAFLLGLAFGAGTALTATAMTPALGALATPLAVAGVVVLVLSLRGLAPFNNPLAYFLGLSSFFYSGLAPTGETLLTLGVAGVIGGLACALAGLAQSLVISRMEARHA